jgi:hypothetical protein
MFEATTDRQPRAAEFEKARAILAGEKYDEVDGEKR